MTRPIVLVRTRPDHAASFEITGERGNEVRFIYTHSDEDALVIARRVACDAVVLDSEGDLNEICQFVRYLGDYGYAERVMVLLPDANGEGSTRLLAAGAAAVLPRVNSFDVVLAVVGRLCRTRAENGRDGSDSDARLRGRDRAVLQLVWDGYTNKEIASRLNCSVSLVKASLQRCFAKAGVRTRTQLMRRVIEDRKWIQTPPEPVLSR